MKNVDNRSFSSPYDHDGKLSVEPYIQVKKEQLLDKALTLSKMEKTFLLALQVSMKYVSFKIS